MTLGAGIAIAVICAMVCVLAIWAPKAAHEIGIGLGVAAIILAFGWTCAR